MPQSTLRRPTAPDGAYGACGAGFFFFFSRSHPEKKAAFPAHFSYHTRAGWCMTEKFFTPERASWLEAALQGQERGAGCACSVRACEVCGACAHAWRAVGATRVAEATWGAAYQKKAFFFTCSYCVVDR